MGDAPKDRPEGGWPERRYPRGADERVVWAMHHDEGYEAGWDRGYKRGLEDAAEIAESLKEPGEVINGPSEWRDGYYTAGQVIAAAIRAQIQERDD